MKAYKQQERQCYLEQTFCPMESLGMIAALLSKNNRLLSNYVYSGATPDAVARAVDQAGCVPVIGSRGDRRSSRSRAVPFRETKTERGLRRSSATETTTAAVGCPARFTMQHLRGSCDAHWACLAITSRVDKEASPLPNVIYVLRVA
jgi:hypothetical protein